VSRKSKKADKKDPSLFGLVASAALLPVLASRFRKARASKDRLEILDVVASAAVIGTGAAKVLRKRRTANSGAGETNG
jgi:hypothetical protein